MNKNQFTTDLNAALSLIDQVEAANIPTLQNRFFALGFNLIINYDTMTAKAERLKSKAFIQKPLFHYRFGTFQRLIEFSIQWISNREAIKASEEKKKALKKEALQKMEHNFKVGGILYDSWGWEQTNIDFYQIIEVNAKSIKIRRIASKYAPEQDNRGLSSMAAYVMPIQDEFIKDEILSKKINALVSPGGSIQYYIKSKHGWISEHVEGSKHYSSWYA